MPDPPYYECAACGYLGFRVVFGHTPSDARCPECGVPVARWADSEGE